MKKGRRKGEESTGTTRVSGAQCSAMIMWVDQVPPWRGAWAWGRAVTSVRSWDSRLHCVALRHLAPKLAATDTLGPVHLGEEVTGAPPCIELLYHCVVALPGAQLQCSSECHLRLAEAPGSHVGITHQLQNLSTPKLRIAKRNHGNMRGWGDRCSSVVESLEQTCCSAYIFPLGRLSPYMWFLMQDLKNYNHTSHGRPGSGLQRPARVVEVTSASGPLLKAKPNQAVAINAQAPT